MIVRWTRRALGDLRHLTDRIEGDDPLAAAKFLSAVQGKVARLQRSPLLGRTGAFEDTRELVMHRNYIVTYRVRADEVQVLQVWHVARDRPRGPRT